MVKIWESWNMESLLFLFFFPIDFLHDLGKVEWGWFCAGSQWAVFYKEKRTETASFLYLLSLHLEKEANSVFLSPQHAAKLNHLVFVKILVLKNVGSFCLSLLRLCSGCGLPSRGQHHSQSWKWCTCDFIQNLPKARGIFSLAFNSSVEMQISPVFQY